MNQLDLPSPCVKRVVLTSVTISVTAVALIRKVAEAFCVWQGMNAELNSQAATLERVNNHVDTTQQGLANVQASAEKTLGKKGEPARAAKCVLASALQLLCLHHLIFRLKSIVNRVSGQLR